MMASTISTAAAPTCPTNSSSTASSTINIQPSPFHPPPGFVFKARLQGKQKRYCQAKWFLQFKWLHYNQDNDTVFCYICMKQNALGKLTTARNKDNAFIVTGYCNWKDALEYFKAHEASECHSISTTYEHILPKYGNIREMTDTSIRASMKENRRCFIKIIESLQYLARQGIAMQGHTDSQSNFLQLLKMRCKDVKELKGWLSRKTNTYISHDIQNEILGLLANSVLREVANDVRNGQCKFYSLCADEYTDISNKEQLSVCFRWIDDDFDSHEDFVGFHQLPNVNAETIYSVLKDVISRLQLSLHDCRGQCYDGASNMLGKKSGVAKRIQDEQPKAHVTHCHCHSLSLGVKDTIKGSKILNDEMDTSREIVKLIKLSPKRENILGEIKNNIEGDTEDHVPGLAQFSATRWTVRATCFKRIFENYQALQDTWCEVLEQSNLSTEIKARVKSCQTQMQKFDYFFGILLGERLFAHTDNLSRTLQGTSMSAAISMRLAKQTIETLQRIRDTKSFDAFFESVLAKKKQIPQIGQPLLKRKQQVPARFAVGNAPAEHPSTPRDRYRPMYFEAVDLLISHIEDRFNQPSFKIYERFESLLLTALNEDVDKLKEVISEIGKEYDDDIDIHRLPCQLGLFRTMVQEENIGCFYDILKAIQKLTSSERAAIREVLTVVNLIHVSPATTANSERSFSSARRLKTWQRSTMTQKRFNSISILNNYQERTDKIDIISIANEFICNYNSKRHFGTFTEKDLQ